MDDPVRSAEDEAEERRQQRATVKAALALEQAARATDLARPPAPLAQLPDLDALLGSFGGPSGEPGNERFRFAPDGQRRV